MIATYCRPFLEIPSDIDPNTNQRNKQHGAPKERTLETMLMVSVVEESLRVWNSDFTQLLF